VKIDPKLALIGLGLAGLGLWVLSKGGLAGAAKAAGGAVVKAAGAAATGGVDATSVAVGIPTTEETTTDPAVARWLIDQVGYWEASFWCGVPALTKGALMDAGTGTPPPPGSAIARHFGTAPANLSPSCIRPIRSTSARPRRTGDRSPPTAPTHHELPQSPFL
jgi:hypothetical protein